MGEAQRRAQKPFEQAEEVQKKKADETLTLGNVNREEGRRSSIVNPYFHLLSATATTSTNISVSPMRRHSNPASPASHFILGNDISFKAPSKRATISPIPQHDPLTKISPLRRAENPFNIILKKEKTERKLN